MNAKQQREWEDDVTQPCAFPEPLAEVLTRENRELRAELADATMAAQNLRDELQGAQERLRRVRELADEIERAGWVDYTYTAEALRAVLAPATLPAEQEGE